MKYLIFGLGNIGPEYNNTRHNIGFQVLDALANASGLVFKSGRYAFTAELIFKGRKLVLVKPATYMNLSGKAVNYWLQKERTEIGNTLTIVDDVALPFGTIRIRAKGNDGGHNGLAHISETLGHSDFPRLRFGIGDNYPKGLQADYVLSEWTEDERKLLPEKITVITEAIKSFVTIGLERTMNFYNGK